MVYEEGEKGSFGLSRGSSGLSKKMDALAQARLAGFLLPSLLGEEQ